MKNIISKPLTDMRQGLKNIFEDSLKYVKLKKNDVVLDIGANDGTLLNYYKKNNFITIGCEIGRAHV